jgi:hypothetical protein
MCLCVWTKSFETISILISNTHLSFDDCLLNQQSGPPMHSTAAVQSLVKDS